MGLLVAVFGGPTALAIAAVALAILVTLFLTITPEGRVAAVLCLFCAGGLFLIVKFVGWAASV